MKHVLAAALSVAAALAQPHARVLEIIDARADHFGKLSRQIWELAALGYKEVQSTALLKRELAQAGFRQAGDRPSRRVRRLLRPGLQPPAPARYR